MKQEEKSRKSKAHILEYAFAEFAAKGYLGASVNTICAAGKISKGLLYHCHANPAVTAASATDPCFRAYNIHRIIDRWELM